MFPGVLDLPGLIIASLLTYFVYKRSRAAAVLLLPLFVLIKAFMYIWLYVFPDLFIAIWVAVSLHWGYLFLQGVRGTFVYHKGKKWLPPELATADMWGRAYFHLERNDDVAAIALLRKGLRVAPPSLLLHP